MSRGATCRSSSVHPWRTRTGRTHPRSETGRPQPAPAAQAGVAAIRPVPQRPTTPRAEPTGPTKVIEVTGTHPVVVVPTRTGPRGTTGTATAQPATRRVLASVRPVSARPAARPEVVDRPGAPGRPGVAVPPRRTTSRPPTAMPRPNWAARSTTGQTRGQRRARPRALPRRRIRATTFHVKHRPRHLRPHGPPRQCRPRSRPAPPPSEPRPLPIQRDPTRQPPRPNPAQPSRASPSQSGRTPARRTPARPATQVSRISARRATQVSHPARPAPAQPSPARQGPNPHPNPVLPHLRHPILRAAPSAPGRCCAR